MSLRMDRAVQGEATAGVWLEERGFSILGAQVVAEHAVHVDGRPVTVTLRADFVVARRGARYVVEVKTGALAPRIETSATRRQMLEYRIAFDVDGVLLVDGETGMVHEITFPALDRRTQARSQPWAAVALVAAAVAAVLAIVRLG